MVVFVFYVPSNFFFLKSLKKKKREKMKGEEHKILDTKKSEENLTILSHKNDSKV